MTLSSINNSRTRSADHIVGTLNRVVSILLQGIALHGFPYERESFERFQAGIRKIRGDFHEGADEDNALLLAGAAIRQMEDHCSEAERYLQARRNEAEAAIAQLAENLWAAVGAPPEALVRLKEAERDLANAGRPEDLAAARQRLAACVEDVRVSSEGSRKPARKAATGEHDAVTGLPDSGYAEVAFESVWDNRKNFFAAVFALERLEAINLRFGFKSGDDVLLILSQHVAQGLRPCDTLFRWRGACLVALVERDVHEALITSEFSRVASTRLEHAIRMKDRQVMVPISMSWNLLPLAPLKNIDELVTGLNDFAANRTRQLR